MYIISTNFLDFREHPWLWPCVSQYTGFNWEVEWLNVADKGDGDNYTPGDIDEPFTSTSYTGSNEFNVHRPITSIVVTDMLAHVFSIIATRIVFSTSLLFTFADINPRDIHRHIKYTWVLECTSAYSWWDQLELECYEYNLMNQIQKHWTTTHRGWSFGPVHTFSMECFYEWVT